MVHVALVQGSCEPPGGQIEVTATLSATSWAWIPRIDGPLACAGEPEPPPAEVPSLRAMGGLVASLLLALTGASCRHRGKARRGDDA